MNNSMNFLKRLMAFLLAMLLVTTMMGDNFSSLADEGETTVEVAELTDSAASSEVEASQVVDTAPEIVEETTVEEPIQEVEETTEPVVEETVDPISPTPTIEETTEDTPEETPEDTTTEEEDTECTHEYTYTSNGDGTHTKVCKLCGEEVTEDCEYGEDGACIHCGYTPEEEEEECVHEWEYISNEDGTHTKRCKLCGEEVVEDCEFDEDGVCKYCGYEDMSLEYQSYSKTIHGVKVTVSGDMPKKSRITVYTKSLSKTNEIINASLDGETFNALEAFDITIYDRHGDKYQPNEDGNTVEVTFAGVEELTDVADDQIVAYRIEDDQESVTEVATDVAGEDVSFDAEHFSTYAVGTISSGYYASLAGYQNFAYIGQGTANYTRVDGTTFYVRYEDESDITFTAYYYKNLTSSSNPTSGTIVDTATYNLSKAAGDYQIDITFDKVANNDNAYVTKGNYYSVVIAASASCQVGYGNGSIATYIKGTTGSFAKNDTYKGMFQENVSTYTTVNDSYTITSVTAKSGQQAADKSYYYTVGDTDTLTATLSDTSVERTITWASSDESIATVDENGKLTAVSTGTVTISATYNKPVSITVHVLGVSIGGTTGTYSTSYTGKEITPAVVVSLGSTTLTSGVTVTYDNNTEVGTTAQVNIAYKPDSNSTCSYTKYFTITAVDITTTGSDGKTAFDDAKYTFSNGSITAVSNVNSNSALSAKPEFADGDFTVAVTSYSSVSKGIQCTLTITGAGNFTGTLTGLTITITGTDISNMFTVKLSSSSRLKDCYYTASAYTLTPTTDNGTATGWSEVTFYDGDGAEVKGVITSATADYTISTSGTTDGDATSAGTKTITFTMKEDENSGYTGSISCNFTIQQASLKNTTIEWLTGQGTSKNQFYHNEDDTAVEPVPGTDFNLKLGDVTLATTEYEASYPTSNHTDVGQTCTLYLTPNSSNFNSTTSNSGTYYIIANYKYDLTIRITDDDGNTYDGVKSGDYATGYTQYYVPGDSFTTPTINAYLPGVGNLTKDTEVTIAVYDDKACTTAVTNTLGTKYILVTPVSTGSYASYSAITGSFTYAARPLTSGVKVTKGSSASAKTFTGADITLTTATSSDLSDKDLTVKYGSTILTEGTDYEITYSNNYNVGTASYTIEGKGNYTGTLGGNSTYRFTISAATVVDSTSTDLTKAIVTIDSSSYDPVYDGTAKEPTVIVKIGTNNTIVKNDSKNDGKANYTLEYSDNRSIGNASVTVTGVNNLTGSVTIPFTIVSSTTAYTKIWIGKEDYEAVYIEGSESTTSGVTTRKYTCPVPVTYTGSNYNGSYNVYGVDSTSALTSGTDYYAEYKNAKNAKTYDSTASNNPCLEITGLNNYAGNNAIVYFSISAADIDGSEVTGVEPSYSWSSTTKVEPIPEVSFNSKTLTANTDYTVAYYDTYDPDDSTKNVALTTAAGTKTMVLTGTGNFTGTKVITYSVGTSLSDVKVSISSYYYDATTNPEIWYEQVENTSTESAPFDIYWRNGKAPKVSLVDTATGTTLTADTQYTYTETSSLGLTGNELYNARAAAGTSDTYNVITYTATPNTANGYYGDAINIYYRIKPQDIATKEATRMYLSSETKSDWTYTGADIKVDPVLIFTYKQQTSGSPLHEAIDNYSCALTGGTDFTPSPINLGSAVGSSITQTVTGIGNYSGTQDLSFNITAGYVSLKAQKDKDSTPVDLGTTSSATTPYDLTADHDIYYNYDGQTKVPNIVLYDTSGTNKLTENKDYTVTYPSDTTSVGEKEITISVTGSNFVAQTITVKYQIISNDISGYYGTLSDITYTGKTIDISAIQTYIANGSATLSLAPTKGGTELTMGTDYELVTDSTELTALNTALNTSYTGIIVTNSQPSYKTNYIFVKGKTGGTYSGYCAIPFTIVLDITSSTGSNSLAKVTFADSTWPLSTEYTIVPTIAYKTSYNASSYDGTIPATTTIDGTAYSNYTLSRSNEGLPGPEEAFAVTGQYLCKGTAAAVLDANNSPVNYRADLATYTGITLDTTLYDYTGDTIAFSSLDWSGLEGTMGTDTTSGDYTVSYTYKQHSSDTATAVSEIKEAGYYTVTITATDNSKYYSSNSGTRFSFWVKYNLADATMTFVDPSNRANTITSTSYTGNAFSIAQSAILTIKETGDLYNYGASGDNVSLVALSPSSITTIGTYTITAAAKDSELVYGTKKGTFTMAGVSLSTYGTFSLSGTSFTYTGGEIKPTVTVTATVGGTTKTLKEGVDYKATYYDNVNVGDNTAYVGITGLGSYECAEFTKDSLKFTIEKLNLSDSHVVAEVEDMTYSGYYLDPSDATKGQVKLVPEYALYYVDTTAGIRNKLQEQTASMTTGDYKYSSCYNNTVAAASTDTNAPTIEFVAGASGNTTGTASKKFNINKLNLNSGSVEIAQNTAEYTGSEIDVSDIVKLTTTYTNASGEEVTVPLTQQGAYEAVGDTICDYKVTISKGNTNYTTGKVTEMGTYSITVTGINSCTSSITEYFTVTERSLSGNYHYYYDGATNAFVPGAWESLYDTTNKRYVSADPASDGLTLYIYDVEAISGEDNPENKPEITIVDRSITDTSTTTGYKHLKEGTDYTVTLTNNSGAGSAAWNKDGDSTTNATVASTSPAITITGKGNYTDSITVPYNIGKNINNLTDITIKYTVTGSDLENTNVYTYDSAKKDTVAWHYTYNGVVQTPSVSITNLSSKYYDVTYTDGAGDEDTSINAGYKYVVITGKGNYCGTISQKYAINRKAVTAAMVKTNTESIVTGREFTNESPMIATSDGTSTGTKQLTFAVTGGGVERLTSTTAVTYLADTDLISEADAAKFVGYYYGVYDGTAIEPTVKVTDNTIGTNGLDISSEDLSITYGTDGQSNTVSTFTNTDGTVTSYTNSVVQIGFTATSATDYSGGNYYADNITFTIQYLIVSHDISKDFDVTFSNELDGPNQKYNAGKAITPEIVVKRGSEILDEDEDYTVSYLDEDGNATNILPGVATITVTGTGNYRGSKSVNFYIWGDLNDTDVYYLNDEGVYVQSSAPVQQYTGKGITYGEPRIYLGLPAQNNQTDLYILEAGTDYQATSNPTSTDSFLTNGTVYYGGLSTAYWTGDISVDYDVEFNAANVAATNYKPTYEYTGDEIIPKFGLNVSTAEITATRFYRNYGESTQAETDDFISQGAITAELDYAIGSKTGTTTATYEITARSINNCTIVLAATQRYTGKAVKPYITVYYKYTDYQTGTTKTKTLTRDTDYSVDYGEFVTGTGYVTITGITENITGTAYKGYAIKLQSVAGLKVTENTGDALTVSWYREIYATGTELVLQKLNSSGVYVTTKTAKVTGKTSTYTFSGLTSGTSYQIKARPYVDGVDVSADYRSVIAYTGVSSSDFAPTSSESGKATVTWNTDSNVTLYYIYRADDETSEGTLCAIIPATSGKYTNTGLAAGTYYYHIDGYVISNAIPKKVNTSEHKPVTVE